MTQEIRSSPLRVPVFNTAKGGGRDEDPEGFPIRSRADGEMLRKSGEDVRKLDDVPTTTYAAMLAEVQDGDTIEALATAVGPTRQKTVGEMKGEQAVEVGLESQVARARPARRVEADKTPDQLLEMLRNRQRTDKAAPGSALDGIQPSSQPRNGSAHDQFILTASQMRPSEVATHATYQAFANIVRILSSDNWVMNTSYMEAPLRTQMKRTGGRPI